MNPFIDNQLATSSGRLELLPEAYPLITELLSTAVKIFPKDAVTPADLQGALSAHMGNTLDLKSLLNSLETGDIKEYQRVILVRLIDAMRRGAKTNQLGGYYEVVHSIYQYDPVLKQLWRDVLCPIPLLDVNATPQNRLSQSIIVSDAGVTKYLELSSGLKFEHMALRGISNAARWVTMLTHSLNPVDMQAFIDQISVTTKVQSHVKGATLTETLCLKLFAIILGEIAKLQDDVKTPISYQMVVVACVLNTIWPDLDTYLRVNTLTHIDDADATGVPFEEVREPIEVLSPLASSERGLFSPNQVYTPSSDSNDLRPRFDEYQNPTSPSSKVVEALSHSIVDDPEEHTTTVSDIEEDETYSDGPDAKEGE